MDTFLAQRLGWTKVIRDGIFPSYVKLVALTLATYGDKDGDDIFPSQRRLVATTQLGETTVRKALKYLREHGLLWRSERGSNIGQRGIADRYRLTLPTDYEARFRFVPEKGPVNDPQEYRPVHRREGWPGDY
jgi:DNA-binding transcriptional MocR family regulator